MKHFNKKLILALAGAMIVFATGCTKKPVRPTPDQTIIAGGDTSSYDSSYAATSNNPPSAWASSGNASNAQTQFSSGAAAGPQNVFGAFGGATTTTTTTSDTLSTRADGGTQVGNEIRGIASLQPIFFDFDRYAIKSSEFGKIQALKDYLAKNPTQRVLIEGHCDWRGTAEYNMALGDRRANAVKRYAISIGIPANKIQTKSLGSTQATERGTEAEMAKDRRGEIVILVK